MSSRNPSSSHPISKSVAFNGARALTPAQWKWMGAALIAVAVFIVYWPAHNGGFIFDDESLLTFSPIIKASDGLYRYWFTTEALDYWPVTNSSFWLEWRLWGMNPTGYHVTNLMLHIADALLVWLVLQKLAVPWPWLAALLFALHPVNVESVAWISQRKNLLAMLFFLCSIWSWLQGEENREARGAGRRTKEKRSPGSEMPLGAGWWYGLSLLAFILAMLSKGSVAILPLVLVLIVWWQRGRIAWSDVIRFLPFFVVAGVLTAVDLWFQTHGTGQVIREVTPIQRLLGAAAVVWFYLGKALVPVDLSFIYPQWDIQTANLLWWLPLIGAVAITAFLVWKRNSPRMKWVRPALFAWTFFCMALLPVMGFTDVTYMLHTLVADHYEHIAVIGVVALAAAAFCYGYGKLQAKFRPAMTVAAGLVVLVFAGLTWRQSGLYANALVLYQDTVKKNPDSWLVQSNLGLELSRRGKYEESIPHFKEALKLNPICAVAHFHWGNALADLNRLPEAVEHYRLAIKIVPEFADAHYRLGLGLQLLDHPKEAEQEYRTALELKPDDAEAHNSLGLMLATRHQFPEAINHFEQAVKADPEFLQAYINLASACAALGRYADAINNAQQAYNLAQAKNETKIAEGVAARLNFYHDRLLGIPEKPAAPAASDAKP
jgi:tetratricopeptide (TPR) repeat protein